MPGCTIKALRILLAFMLMALPLGAIAIPPAYLDISSATLEELPPIDPHDTANRNIRIRLELTTSPACNAGTTYLAYGLLIDADRNVATGLAGPEFSDIGADARIDVHCDAATSSFVSSAGGTVAVFTDASTGLTVVDNIVPITHLPSLNFHWIAFAQENTDFVRLPNTLNHGLWATHEILLY